MMDKNLVKNYIAKRVAKELKDGNVCKSWNWTTNASI